jgi:hypothetical protein
MRNALIRTDDKVIRVKAILAIKRGVAAREDEDERGGGGSNRKPKVLEDEGGGGGDWKAITKIIMLE